MNVGLEPGVYLTDRFGIRIENLVLVTTIPTKVIDEPEERRETREGIVLI